MMPQERLGERLFLVLATFTVLGKLSSVYHGMFGFGGDADFLLQPADVHRLLSLILVLFVPFVWKGNGWLLRLVGVAYDRRQLSFPFRDIYLSPLKNWPPWLQSGSRAPAPWHTDPGHRIAAGVWRSGGSRSAATATVAQPDPRRLDSAAGLSSPVNWGLSWLASPLPLGSSDRSIPR